MPDYPRYHDDAALEEERVALIEEMTKKKKNTTLIKWSWRFPSGGERW